MKKNLALVALTLVFLAVFLPLASNDPDGLEKVAGNMGVEEQQTVWKGLFSDYSVESVGNSYVSSFFAGTFGVAIVSAAMFALGTAITSKKRKDSGKQ